MLHGTLCWCIFLLPWLLNGCILLFLLCLLLSEWFYGPNHFSLICYHYYGLQEKPSSYMVEMARVESVSLR